MKVIIIGDSGFIGKSIFDYLYKTMEFDLKGISTIEIDLTEEKSYSLLSKNFSSESIIIMCAGVKKQLGDSLDTFEKNSIIINNFCKAITLVPPKRIIFFSSASVYGEDVDYKVKITEETAVKLKTYYGIAKYNAECLLYKICNDIQTELVILRPPLIYGIDDHSKGYGPTGFTYKTLKHEEIVLWGGGNELREFIYIDDVSNTIYRLLKSSFNGVLNLVSGNSYTFRKVIDLLKEISKSDINFVSRKRSKEKVDHNYSNELFNNIIPDFEFTQLEHGLKKMYNSLNENN